MTDLQLVLALPLIAATVFVFGMPLFALLGRWLGARLDQLWDWEEAQLDRLADWWGRRRG